MLYGENVFEFETMDLTESGSPGSWIDGRECEYALNEQLSLVTADTGNDSEPFLSENKVRIRDALLSIENQKPLKQEYNSCDHFVRFLHTIGKQNAQLIRKLQFSGTLLLHGCHHFNGHIFNQPGNEKLCNKDLIDSLHYYTPIVTKLCTNLQGLSVGLIEDHLATRDTLSDLLLDGTPEHHFQKRLLTFLNEDNQVLRSIQNLDIYKFKQIDQRTEREEIDFAKPIIENLKKKYEPWRKLWEVAEPMGTRSKDYVNSKIEELVKPSG